MVFLHKQHKNKAPRGTEWESGNSLSGKKYKTGRFTPTMPTKTQEGRIKLESRK